MQARRIARELALLSVSQLPANPKRITEKELSHLLVAAIRTLTSETQDTLETAAAELKQGHDRLLEGETRTATVEQAAQRVSEAIMLTQTAINRLGVALELPEFIQLSNQQEVRAYALEILSTLASERTEIDAKLSRALVDWQLERLAQIDRDILRIAIAEILYLDQPARIAINEAVELAKRYSGDDGFRFINGVLRCFTEQLKASSDALTASSVAATDTSPLVAKGNPSQVFESR
jgi:transcription antitermination protein NusB